LAELILRQANNIKRRRSLLWLLLLLLLLLLFLLFVPPGPHEGLWIISSIATAAHNKYINPQNLLL